MTFTIDSNILVYAIDRRDAFKHEIAVRILKAAPERGGMVTTQALGEFLNVIRRKHPEHLPFAIARVRLWTQFLSPVATSSDHLLSAIDFAERHHLQFWDSVIWQVAQSAGANHLLSEDMHDGLSLDGMMVIDPFNRANEARLADLIRA